MGVVMSSKTKAKRKAAQVAAKKQRREDAIKKQNALSWVLNPRIVPYASLAHCEALASTHLGPVIPYNPMFQSPKEIRRQYFARQGLPDPRSKQNPQPVQVHQVQPKRPNQPRSQGKVATVRPQSQRKKKKLITQPVQQQPIVIKKKKKKKTPKEPEVIQPVRYKVELEEIPVTIGNEL
jgi:hypothetical protein